MCSGIHTHGHMRAYAASQVKGSQQISTTLFQWFYAKGTRAQPGSEQSPMDRVIETKSEISDLGLTSRCKVQGDVQWMRRRGADNATAGMLWQENNRHVQCDFGAARAYCWPQLSEAEPCWCVSSYPLSTTDLLIFGTGSWGKEKLHWPRCAAGQRHTGIFYQLPDFSQLIWGQVFQVECQL